MTEIEFLGFNYLSLRPNRSYDYLLGVTQNSIGSYSSNYPYRLQYNAAGDYIQIYTDKAAGDITFRVKKIGGATNSTFIVEGCATANGTYAEINSFTIWGA